MITDLIILNEARSYTKRVLLFRSCIVISYTERTHLHEHKCRLELCPRFTRINITANQQTETRASPNHTLARLPSHLKTSRKLPTILRDKLVHRDLPETRIGSSGTSDGSVAASLGHSDGPSRSPQKVLVVLQQLIPEITDGLSGHS